MVTVGELEMDLFGGELASLDEIRQLALYVNSSEVGKIAFAEQIEESGDSLRAAIGNCILSRYAEAIEKFKGSGDCMEKFVYLGIAQRQTGMFDDALKSFDRAGKLNADALMVSLEKAATLREAERFDDAAKELKGCANFEKVSAEYHYQLGRLADAQGEYGQAMSNYEIATDLDDSHNDALFQLAYSCDLRGDEDAAIDYYMQITTNTPVHVSALLNLAVLYEDMGDYDKAGDCVDIVLFSHPNHKKALLFSEDVESSKVMVYDEEREKRIDRRTKILETPISDFELSVRSRNCLRKMNIRTLGDLLRISETELMSYKNFGETSLVEIKEILDSKSLELGMALREEEAAEGAKDSNDAASEELAGKSIDDLELSVRAKRALLALDLRTFGDVISKTEAELLGCKNFGVTSLNEIKDRLTNFGLGLRKLD
ncbi:MAG: tetratricopeptide repeat protein [Planctomycetes bacterium]|nr:tetratricopeptide repeat protein [Planctomycetota bacterium]